MNKQGAVDLPQFLAQARTPAEAEELQTTFEDFDKIEGGPDGRLTFRKFATGTLMQTPLGKMRDETFEQTVGTMISDVRGKMRPKEPPAEVS